MCFHASQCSTSTAPYAVLPCQPMLLFLAAQFKAYLPLDTKGDLVYSKVMRYEAVDVNEFLGVSPDIDDEGIVIFSSNQKHLVDGFMQYMEKNKESGIEHIKQRIEDLNLLAAAVARFPSLLETHDSASGMRTPQGLIDSLIEHQATGDDSLRLPSKVSLGKAFLVAKIHAFATMAQRASRIKELSSLSQSLQNEVVSMMFSLMVEDVYMNLIKDTSQRLEFRKEWASSLLLLWEHRNDQTIAAVAPVLQAVWTARRRLAPAFGTMMGTSELLLISMQMDEQWTQFIKLKLGESGVTDAMEEFLFGLSYEQIHQLRTALRELHVSAIGRDEVAEFLGIPIKEDARQDYRDFYNLYTVRRDNARARNRMDLPGPHKTLEDHFICFVTEQNYEKQMKDAAAGAAIPQSP